VRIVLTVDAPPGAPLGTIQGLVRSAGHASEALSESHVELLRDDTVVSTTSLNEFGHFTLSNVPAGVYVLQVRFPDQVVVIPEVTLLQ
jgi:hypothetical protein